MRRLFILAVFFWPFSAFGDVDASIVQKIVLTELYVTRLPTTSPFCLAILPSATNSPTGADPSPELLAFLSQHGMHPKRASTCYKALKGNVISIELIPEEHDRVSARVAFADVTIPPGEDLGTLRRRGVYHFTKSSDGAWKAQSYTAEIVEEDPKSRAGRP